MFIPSFRSRQSVFYGIAGIAYLYLFLLVPGSSLKASPLFSYVAIYGQVWNDSIGNGLQESNEVGVSGIHVQFYQVVQPGVDQLLTEDVSDANGDFVIFPGLPTPGTYYYLRIDPDELVTLGYDFASGNKPTLGDAFDSDFDQKTGETASFQIFELRLYFDWDAGLIQIPNCEMGSDIVISFDSSGYLTDDNFGFIQDFMIDIARSFEFNQDNTRIGVVQLNARGHTRNEILLSQSSTLNNFENSVNNIHRITGVNATDIFEGLYLPLLQFGNFILHRGNGNITVTGQFFRPNVPHSIILITDGDHRENRPASDVTNIAEGIKALGIQIFVVKITNFDPYTLALMQSVATQIYPPYLFQDIGNHKDLISTLNGLVNGICSSTTAIPVRNYYTMRTPSLTWSQVIWAVGYEIEVSMTEDFDNLVMDAQVPANQLQIQTRNLADGIYYWRVRAQRTIPPTITWGDWSLADNFMIDGP